jgi:hypothetical protein
MCEGHVLTHARAQCAGHTQAQSEGVTDIAVVGFRVDSMRSSCSVVIADGQCSPSCSHEWQLQQSCSSSQATAVPSCNSAPTRVSAANTCMSSFVACSETWCVPGHSLAGVLSEGCGPGVYSWYLYMLSVIAGSATCTCYVRLLCSKNA